MFLCIHQLDTASCCMYRLKNLIFICCSWFPHMFAIWMLLKRHCIWCNMILLTIILGNNTVINYWDTGQQTNILTREYFVFLKEGIVFVYCSVILDPLLDFQSCIMLIFVSTWDQNLYWLIGLDGNKDMSGHFNWYLGF